MPFYETMMLGFKGLEKAKVAAKQAGFEAFEDVDQQRWVLEAIPGVPTDSQAILKRINLGVIESLSEFGFDFLGAPEPKNNGFANQDFLVKTPEGYEVTANSIRMRLAYDPFGELEDEPEDCVFGILLSGRYYPRLLDLDEESGGLEKDDDGFSWNTDAADWQKFAAERARRLIVEAFPHFADATLLQRREFA